MTFGEAERCLGAVPTRPSHHPTDTRETVAHDVWMDCEADREYSAGGRYRVVLYADCQLTTVRGKLLYRQEVSLFGRLLHTLGFTRQ
jgi:hypothetical protein